MSPTARNELHLRCVLASQFDQVLAELLHAARQAPDDTMDSLEEALELSADELKSLELEDLKVVQQLMRLGVYTTIQALLDSTDRPALGRWLE